MARHHATRILATPGSRVKFSWWRVSPPDRAAALFGLGLTVQEERDLNLDLAYVGAVSASLSADSVYAVCPGRVWSVPVARSAVCYARRAGGWCSVWASRRLFVMVLPCVSRLTILPVGVGTMPADLKCRIPCGMPKMELQLSMGHINLLLIVER